MPNWVISCHGYSNKASAAKIGTDVARSVGGALLPGAALAEAALTTRLKYQNCRIPTGVELVTYTRQGQSLSMADGWDLWKMLVENGNEVTAYARKHKAKKNQSIINYGLSGPHDAADYKGWMSSKGVCACGLFKVGNVTAIETWHLAQEYCRLGDVLNRAKKERVARVYYLACQELG